MKAWIIDETGITKNGERIVTSRVIKQIEIPDKLFSDFKEMFEAWQRENSRENKDELN